VIDTPEHVRPRNRLLAALPARELRRLQPLLATQSMEMKQVVFPEGATIGTVYFPVDSVVSLLTRMQDDRGVEIATIGNEGLVGITVALGASVLDARDYAVVQVPGTAVAMDVDEFRAEMDRAGPFASMMQRYARAFLTQVTQQVACNNMHSVEERCCRWILSTGDRVGTAGVPMTHGSSPDARGATGVRHRHRRDSATGPG
jgi:CRP-like cAMP-binding protein